MTMADWAKVRRESAPVAAVSFPKERFWPGGSPFLPGLTKKCLKFCGSKGRKTDLNDRKGIVLCAMAIRRFGRALFCVQWPSEDLERHCSVCNSRPKIWKGIVLRAMAVRRSGGALFCLQWPTEDPEEHCSVYKGHPKGRK